MQSLAKRRCIALSLCLFLSASPIPHVHSLITSSAVSCVSFGRFSSTSQQARRLHAKKGNSDNTGDGKVNKKKGNLPTKICIQCNRPMEWRKSWAKNWDEVKYCSDKCRKLSKSNKRGDGENTHATRIATGIIAALTLLFPHTSWADKNPIRPSVEELRSVFDSDTWSPEDTYSSTFKTGDFRRLDETVDSNFYTEPRFVEHIDVKAVDALIAYHSSELEKIGTKFHGSSRYPSRVLDLCSSWVSHLPSWYSDISPQNRETVGIGMQSNELARNTQLTKGVVQDLNILPKLPFEDKSFDVVLCQLSIDYLTKPVEVIKEAGRVLSDEGTLYISFSNRVFIEKAVGVWTGKSDLSHIETVGDYIHFSGAFDDASLEALDLRKGMNTGDPLYVVKAMKRKQI